MEKASTRSGYSLFFRGRRSVIIEDELREVVLEALSVKYGCAPYLVEVVGGPINLVTQLTHISFVVDISVLEGPPSNSFPFFVDLMTSAEEIVPVVDIKEQVPIDKHVLPQLLDFGEFGDDLVFLVIEH